MKVRIEMVCVSADGSEQRKQMQVIERPELGWRPWHQFG
jgi:hypothetical protein